MRHGHDWVAGIGGGAIIAEVAAVAFVFARERGAVARKAEQDDGAEERQPPVVPRPSLPDPESGDANRGEPSVRPDQEGENRSFSS